MLRVLKYQLNLVFLTNPYFLFCMGFSLAIFLYMWEWSNIYPVLSGSVIIFLAATFSGMLTAGIMYERKRIAEFNSIRLKDWFYHLIFTFILLLGILNIALMGYIPLFNRSIDYREFGFPVIDVLFNTLCIFFFLVFLRTFLENKKGKWLLFYCTLIIIQVFLFRRSTIIWILVSSLFLIILLKKKLPIYIPGLLLVLLPLISYCFGLYGNYRSNITRQDAFRMLGASENFNKTGLSHNHYMSYLYISSPLANLQKSIDFATGIEGSKDIREFVFYCIIPSSLTSRIEQTIGLEKPNPVLITPWLLVGTCFTMSYLTAGWYGMILMTLYILVLFAIVIYAMRKWNSFDIIGLSLLSTTSLIMIFDNILNRLDTLMLVLIYPLLFHFLFSIRWFRERFMA